MDVLSEVPKVGKLQGAIFYNGEFSAPTSRILKQAKAEYAKLQ